MGSEGTGWWRGLRGVVSERFWSPASRGFSRAGGRTAFVCCAEPISLATTVAMIIFTNNNFTTLEMGKVLADR